MCFKALQMRGDNIWQSSLCSLKEKFGHLGKGCTYAKHLTSYDSKYQAFLTPVFVVSLWVFQQSCLGTGWVWFVQLIPEAQVDFRYSLSFNEPESELWSLPSCCWKSMLHYLKPLLHVWSTRLNEYWSGKTVKSWIQQNEILKPTRLAKALVSHLKHSLVIDINTITSATEMQNIMHCNKLKAGMVQMDYIKYSTVPLW